MEEGHGLDAEKLDVLRRWGLGLQTDARAEVAAAGRAILLLTEEIERLHVLVWDKRLYPEQPLPELSDPTDGQPATLRERRASLLDLLFARFPHLHT